MDYCAIVIKFQYINMLYETRFNQIDVLKVHFKYFHLRYVSFSLKYRSTIFFLLSNIHLSLHSLALYIVSIHGLINHRTTTTLHCYLSPPAFHTLLVPTPTTVLMYRRSAESSRERDRERSFLELAPTSAHTKQ